MEVIYSLFYVWIFSRNPTTWSTDGNLLIHEKNRKELDSVNLKEREFERTKFYEWEHVLSFRKFFENSQNDEIWLLWSSSPTKLSLLGSVTFSRAPGMLQISASYVILICFLSMFLPEESKTKEKRGMLLRKYSLSIQGSIHTYDLLFEFKEGKS